MAVNMVGKYAFFSKFVVEDLSMQMNYPYGILYLTENQINNIMENTSHFTNAGNQGYILLPRRLLNVYLGLEETDSKYHTYKLYINLLVRATYGEKAPEEGGLWRGELYYSARALSEHMHITRYALEKELDKLKKAKLIELYPSKKRGESSRMKLLYYDQMCRFATVYEKASKKTEEEFDIFWDIYHDTAGLQPVDRERAFRAWKLLDKEERFLAVGNMIPYLSLFKYKCNSAADYLTYKCFNMSE